LANRPTAPDRNRVAIFDLRILCGHVARWENVTLDKVRAAAFLASDRVHVLRQAIMCCRKAGTVSIPGVYVGMGDKIPLGAAMNKGLTFKTGQTHVQAYAKPLLKKIIEGKIDPSFVVNIPPALKMRLRCTRNFGTKRTGSSRSSCALVSD
jgi:threonine dehydrogenase-like Zn-dependent dehydrogenase